MVTATPSQPLRRRTRSLSAGQAMVEFALITPVFFLVFFSILEFALITASIGTYDFGARDGARVAAIFGPSDPNIDTETSPTTGIVATIRGHVQGIVMAQATEIDIYDADPASGQCISSTGGTVAVDTLGCYEEAYSLQGAPLLVCPTCTPWPPASRNASVTNDNYVGVRVLYQYTYVTGFVAGLGTNLSLSATSVQELEPQSTDVRQRGPSTVFDGIRHNAQVVTMAARRPAGSPDSPACLAMAPSAWWLRQDPGGCA